MLEGAANYNFVRPQFADKVGALGQGVGIGLGLGGAIRSRMDKNKEEEVGNNIPIQDPGEMQQVDPKMLFQDEMKQLNNYKNAQKQLSQIKDPNLKAETQMNLANTVEKQNPMISEFYRYNVPPQEIENTLRSFLNGDPSSQQQVEILIGKTGGKNGTFAKSLEQKKQQAQQIQDKFKQEYSFKLRSSLDQIETAREKIGKYAGNAKVSESVLNGIEQEGNYLAKLATLSKEDLDWANAYLARQQQKRGVRSGGAKPTHFEGLTKEGKSVYGSYNTVQDFMNDTGAVKVTGQIGYTTPTSNILGKADIKKENKKNEPDEFGFVIGEKRTLKNGKTVEYIGNDEWK